MRKTCSSLHRDVIPDACILCLYESRTFSAQTGAASYCMKPGILLNVLARFAQLAIQKWGIDATAKPIDLGTTKTAKEKTAGTPFADRGRTSEVIQTLVDGLSTGYLKACVL